MTTTRIFWLGTLQPTTQAYEAYEIALTVMLNIIALQYTETIQRESLSSGEAVRRFFRSNPNNTDALDFQTRAVIIEDALDYSYTQETKKSALFRRRCDNMISIDKSVTMTLRQSWKYLKTELEGVGLIQQHIDSDERMKYPPNTKHFKLK
jgi:hypothetical protein